ncbi:MAG: PKD domain-containing protein [Methanobacteriota archaeon]
MSGKILVCSLIIAVLMALLVLLSAKDTDVLGSNDVRENMVSPLFVTRIHSFLKNETLDIQANYLGRFEKPLEVTRIKPPSRRSEEVIAFHNGDIIGGIGPTYLRVEWEAAIRITPAELAPYEGWEIIGARFFHWENRSHEGSLKIYDEGNDTSPGDLMSSESYNVSGHGWKRIDLTDPVPLDITKDIWTSIFIIKHGSGGDYSMGIDSGPAIDGKGDWVKLSPDHWDELQWFGYDNNLAIEAIVSPSYNPSIDGPTWGIINVVYTFSINVDDSQGESVYCLWDWGDGNTSGWLGPYNSTTISASHAWSKTGTYEIRVKLKDVYGQESDWLEPHVFTVYELKKAFLFGSYSKMYTNLSTEGDYNTVEAVNLRMILFKPFQFLHYIDGKTITFSKDNVKALITSRFLIGLLDVVT